MGTCSLIEDLGYSGWIGCEYRPAGATSAGLGWFAPWRDRNYLTRLNGTGAHGRSRSPQPQEFASTERL